MSNSGLVAYGVDSDEETDKNSGAVSGNEPSTESRSQEEIPSREGSSVTESEKETEKKRSSSHSDREKDRRHDRDRDREDRYYRDRNKRSVHHDDRRDRDRRRDDRTSGRDRRDDRRRRSRDRDHRRTRDWSRSPRKSSPSPVRNQESNTRKDVQPTSAATTLPTQFTAPGSQPRPPVNPPFTGITTKAQRAQEEIQKRKALWNKDKPTTSTELWSATAFTEDQDGKVSAKFKRLMGIKNAEEASGSQEKPAEDLIKKQQELFANLDAQYAVARATTHTQRGLGLGFGSQNFHH